MSKKSYKFNSANMGIVNVDVVGLYRDGEKDLVVEVGAEYHEFSEIDAGAADDIINWLLSLGVEFESDRSMKFSSWYISSVMLDEDLTEEQLIDMADKWTDEEIAGWKTSL